ncbi:MAG: hypothetical protein GY895_20925 [Phycisphaera sp.]|nr:hypothetical protein [Phycisphaera sp.]
MKIRSVIVLALALTSAAVAEPPRPATPHVVFVVGEGEYRSEWSMPALADLLEREHGFETTVLVDRRLNGGPGNDVEGLEALEDADLAVFYVRFRQLPQDQLDRIADFVGGGGAVVGFRTSTHAFDYPDDDPRAARWNDFGADVLGAPWKYHYGHDSRTAVSTVDGAGEVLLAGVPDDFSVRSWTYHVRDDFPPDDATVLALGRPIGPNDDAGDDDTVNPLAWTWIRPDGGRTFTTTMGHPRDFAQSGFRQLVVNGIHWALERPVPSGEVGAFPRFKERTGEPWQDMDYGPFLSAAIEVDPDNIASKGIAIPLNDDGSTAALFDTAELRWAAGWQGDFVELRGIVYDGPHGTWPRIDGEPDWTSPAGPGIDAEIRGRFEDPRAVPFGPLPKDLGRFEGLVAGDDGVVLRYTVGDATVLERMTAQDHDDLLVWSREIDVVDVAAPFDLSLFGIEADVSLDAEETPRSTLETKEDRRVTIVKDGGEVIGAIGWVDSDMEADPRGTGKAALIGGVNLHPGRLAARIMPKLEEAGDGRFRILFARLDEDRLPDFLDRVAAAEWGGDLQSVWNAGSPSRWTETVVLEGELDVRFGEPDDSVEIIRLGPGDATLSNAGEPGSTPKLFGMDGVEFDAKIAPIDEAIMVFEDRPDAPPVPIAGWNFDEDPSPMMQNVVTGAGDLRLEGVTWRRGVQGRSLDFDGTARAVWLDAGSIDAETTPFTISAWIHTTKDGTIAARTSLDGDWAPDGATFFVNDGRLAWDIGWVGVIEGETVVADGRWHHVAVASDPEDGDVTLWVDGVVDAEGVLAPEGPTPDHVLSVGFTNEDFPAESRFSGYLDGLRIHPGVLDRAAIRAVAAESGEPFVDARSIEFDAPANHEIVDDRVVTTIGAEAAIDGIDGLVRTWTGPRSRLASFIAELENATAARASPFRIDRVSWPRENPWDSWMRFGDFDFLEGGGAAAISTWNGDVWRVDGLDAELDRLEWRRIASGLSQPLGLATRGEEILVVGRDQITRLVDLDGDRETDRYEAFNVDAMNSPHFHEPASGLQIGPDGSLYYIKAARHAKLPLHPRHGTLVRVDADGSGSEIVASGFRAPNGVAVDPDGIAWGSDQEGHWMPANRINRIETGSFHGNNWSGSRLDLEPLDSYEPPLLWIHPTVDRSPAAQLRVPDGVWGELAGRLLGVSYGTGEVYLILEEETGGMHQGALVPLPIQVPTGLMRGRFHPDGSLYVAGLFGWSSDQTDPGGFYRVRRTETPMPIPTRVRAENGGLLLEFDQPVSTPERDLADSFDLTGWNYRWTSDYGSPQLDLRTGEPGRTSLRIAEATRSKDGRVVRLEIPGMCPAMQMHLDWQLDFEGIGERASFVHFTVHALGSATTID